MRVEHALAKSTNFAKSLLLLTTVVILSSAFADEEPKTPVPPSPLFEIVGEWRELNRAHSNITVDKQLKTSTRVVSGTLVWEPSEQAYFLYDRDTADLGGTVYTWLVFGRIINTYRDNGETEYVKNLARLSFDPAGRLHVHTVSRKGYKDEPKVDEYIFELTESTLKQREEARVAEETRKAQAAAERVRQEELRRKIETNQQVVEKASQKNLSDLLSAYKNGTLTQRPDLKGVPYPTSLLRYELLTILKKQVEESPEAPPAQVLDLLEWVSELKTQQVSERTGDIETKDLRLTELLGKESSTSYWAISSSDAWHKLLSGLAVAEGSLGDAFSLATTAGFKMMVSERESDQEKIISARALERIKQLLTKQFLSVGPKVGAEVFGLPTFSSGSMFVFSGNRSAYSTASYTRLEKSLTFLQAAVLEPTFPLELLEHAISLSPDAASEIYSKEVLNTKATLFELASSYSRMFRDVCAPQKAPKALTAQATKGFEIYSRAIEKKLQSLEKGRTPSSKKLSFMRENAKCEFQVISAEKLRNYEMAPSVSNLVFLLPQFVSSSGTDTYRN